LAADSCRIVLEYPTQDTPRRRYGASLRWTAGGGCPHMSNIGDEEFSKLNSSSLKSSALEGVFLFDFIEGGAHCALKSFRLSDEARSGFGPLAFHAEQAISGDEAGGNLD